MNLRTSSVKGFLLIFLFAIIAAGCSKGAPRSAGNKGAKADSEKQGLSVDVPESGSMTERVRSLWATTLPIIRNDASAGLSDADYQARRVPLFSAWVTLQARNGSAAKPSERISRLIPRILELIDHVYGFPGTPRAERIKERQNKGRTEYIIADIEKQIKALPK